jgi:CheY-like chemotaxis protein/translation initiation factor IF-1
VLVVEADLTRRLEAERTLRSVGYVVDAAASVRQALDRCYVGSYDVAIVGLDLGPGGDGRSLVRWFGGHSPSTRLVIVGGPLTAAEELEFRTAAPRVFPPGTAVASVAEAAIGLGARRGFFGHAIEVELFDYVQMVAISGRDKLLEVETPLGAGRIWIDHGDVVHVEYAGEQGERAFYRLLATGHGGFREAFYVDPPVTTIHGSSMHLLMEAARQMDEGVLGLEGGDGEVGAPAVGSVDHDETSFADVDEEGVHVDDDTVLGADDGPSIDFPTDDDEILHPAPVPAPGLTPGRGPASPTPASAPTARAQVATSAASAAPARPRVATPPAAAAAIPGRSPTTAVGDARLPSSAAIGAPSQVPETSSTALSLLDDPETRDLMLGQFFQFEGVNGAAIISSSGKVLAEDMRSNASLVTLAGFYMRGAGRIARDLGYNVFDGVIARAANGSQLLMLSMGATTAVLSIEVGVDPEGVRQEILGVES